MSWMQQAEKGICRPLYWAVAWLFITSASGALAQDFTVNTTSDGTGFSDCGPLGRACTLRAAIGFSISDTITFNP